MSSWPTIDKLPLGMSASAPGAEEPDMAKPFVQNDGQLKSLHFSMGELQSRMNTQDPSQLEVDYTRTMMGFLLLHPAPASIGMVGLGGGSLAKFCYVQLPQSRLTVLEINPHVIALRREFEVPDDDARLKVIQADGAAFMALQKSRFDVLLVDGFDPQGQPAALCSQGFYDACFTALKPDGVLVVNLHYDDADYALWLARIQRSFVGNACEVAALEMSNCIVFACRMDSGIPMSPRRINLKASLSQLKPDVRPQLRQEFARIAWCMRDLDSREAD